jgi:hypothetical protein
MDVWKGEVIAPTEEELLSAGAAQEDIGQSFASTRRKSFSLTRGSFHGGVSSARPYAMTPETRFALFGIWRPGRFIGPRL